MASLLYKTSNDRQVRKEKLEKICQVRTKTLHVFFESELGKHQEVSEFLAQLVDNCECPTRVQVHILEPVSSIKSIDLLTPTLIKACGQQPRYATFFDKNVHILKVHQSRNLTGPRACDYLCTKLKLSIPFDDYVLWIPFVTSYTIQKNWDTYVYENFQSMESMFAQANLQDEPFLLTYPFSNKQEEWNPNTLLKEELTFKASFFALDDSLQFTIHAVCVNDIVPSIGVSFRHCFGGIVHQFSDFVAKCAQMDNISDDLALSFVAAVHHYHLYNGSIAIVRREAKRRVTNRRLQLQSLHKVFDLYPEYKDVWLESVALQISEDDDLLIYGRAYMGMTKQLSKEEILTKWGSEEAFETEKEALKYG